MYDRVRRWFPPVCGVKLTAMPVRSAASPAVSERLLDAAAALAARGGVRAVTARAVGEAAGASPSALNYAYGGRDGLLAAMFQRARRDAAGRRAAALEDLDGLGLGSAHFGDWLANLLQLDAACAPALTALRREALLQAERTPALTPAAADWLADETAFAAQALDRFGIVGVSPGVVCEALLALADLFPPEAASPAHAAWCAEAARWFADRITGRTPVSAGWRAAIEARAARAIPPPADRPEPACRILDGAIRLMARTGAAGLTHRALAEESGVSLAATTHYFESRDAILQAAFERLYARLAAEALAIREESRPTGWAALPAGIAFATIGTDGSIRTELGALDELLAAACRETRLRPFADHLLASRGGTIARALAGGAAPEASLREDAFLVSLLGVAGLGALRVAPPAARRALAETLTTARFHALLGPASGY